MTESTPLRKVFISYRRADHGDFVERIRDWLASRYGRDQVFMDFDSIPPFVTFEEFIEERISAADVVIVILGPRWVELMRERIDSGEDDYVLFELESALRLNKFIAPICIKGGLIPAAADLPENLRPLRKINAPSLDSGKVFYDNIEAIIDGIEVAYDRRQRKLAAAIPTAPEAQTDPQVEQAVQQEAPPKPRRKRKLSPPVETPIDADADSSLNPAPSLPVDENRVGAAEPQQPQIEEPPPRLGDIELLAHAGVDLHKVEALLKQAKDEQKRNNNREAIAFYSAALDLDPNNPEALSGRGDMYIRENRFDEALADYSEAIRLNPTNITNYRHRADAYSKQRSYAAAIADLTQAMQIAGYEDSSLYLNRGQARENSGDLQGAVEDYTATIRLYESDLYYLFRARALEKMGDYTGAIVDYEMVIHLNRLALFGNWIKNEAKQRIPELKKKLRQR